jgi:hypothetical protein
MRAAKLKLVGWVEPNMPNRNLSMRSLNTRLFLVTAAGAALAALLASCASTGGLVAATPQGVDLSGQWRLNENLSDDPGRIEEPKELPLKTPSPSRNPGGFGRPGTGMPGGPGGPGSLDPGGGGENLTSTGGGAGGLVPVLYAQDATLPSSSSDSGSTTAASKPTGPVARMLNAPALLTISQSGGKLVVKSTPDGTTEEFTAGEQRTIPFGQTQADRSSGWRESAFVVVTKAHKGPSKEDDFALDSEGHLIFATLVTHVKKGPIDFKRVYDRVRTP